MRRHRIAILGAGPAGLTAASLLKEKSSVEPVVLEKSERVGGKSWTVKHGPLITELGTCYSTRAHRYTDKLMKRLGFQQTRLGRQVFDGDDFVAYLKSGDGSPLALQALKFLMLRAEFMWRAERTDPDQRTLDEAAKPIGEWLKGHDLPKMELFMHRALTVMGYGYVETTSTIQALRWCDLDLVLTGVRNHLYWPNEGWSTFWQALAREFEVRTDIEVERIDRYPDRVDIVTDRGVESFDGLINAVAPDTFASLVEPTASEKWVADSITWQGYFSTIVAVDNWFSEWETEGYSESATADDKLGRLVAVRCIGADPELGGRLYFTGQTPGDFSDEELKELLRHEITRRGGEVKSMIHSRRWKYFPMYDREAIAGGLTATMKRMQGEERTWHTGAAFCHEAVSNISRHNEALIPSLVQALEQSEARPADQVNFRWQHESGS
ncbi:MAG: FAD-dependent oxidoreductase [Pseudomonadota bacterium]